MASLALLQSTRISVDSSFVDYLIIGVYFAFTIIGAIMVLYGLLGSPENERSLGINLNLWWGLFMAVFGGAFVGISHAVARHRAAREARG